MVFSMQPVDSNEGLEARALGELRVRPKRQGPSRAQGSVDGRRLGGESVVLVPPRTLENLTPEPQAEAVHLSGGDAHFLKEWQRVAIIYILQHFADPTKKPGFILADEMGLGKTLTAIMVMKALHMSKSLRLTYPDDGGRVNRWTSGLFLVVAHGGTLKKVWQEQVRQYAGKGVKVHIYHGRPEDRQRDLQECLKEYAGGTGAQLSELCDDPWRRAKRDYSAKMLVVVSTYETLAIDCGVCKNKRPRKGPDGGELLVKRLPYTLCVFDEAHKAKGGPEDPPLTA